MFVFDHQTFVFSLWNSVPKAMMVTTENFKSLLLEVGECFLGSETNFQDGNLSGPNKRSNLNQKSPTA